MTEETKKERVYKVKYSRLFGGIQRLGPIVCYLSEEKLKEMLLDVSRVQYIVLSAELIEIWYSMENKKENFEAYSIY